MKLDVPYYSQFKDVVRQDFKEKACTMSCLKMVGDFLSPGVLPNVDQLIEEALVHAASMKEHGLINEAYSPHGFTHVVIVSLAHNFGLPAYQEEFKSYSLDQNKKPVPGSNSHSMLENGLKKIRTRLEAGTPPIVSVLPGLSDGKSFHTILLIGYEENDGTLTGFYYHDPDSKNEEKRAVFISLNDFVKYWRKMAIFIG